MLQSLQSHIEFRRPIYRIPVETSTFYGAQKNSYSICRDLEWALRVRRMIFLTEKCLRSSGLQLGFATRLLKYQRESQSASFVKGARGNKLDYALRSRGCSRSPVNRDRKFSHFPASSTRRIVPALNRVQLSHSCSVASGRCTLSCKFNGGFLSTRARQIVGSMDVVDQSINLFARFSFLQNSFVIHLSAEEIRRNFIYFMNFYLFIIEISSFICKKYD